jgi:dihydroneopterin aldolase
MDRILVEGIEFHGFHGVPDAEQAVGHRYRVDLALELDLAEAGRTDDLSRTIDYGDAARLVLEIGTGPSARLVETLAERMAAALLGRYPQLQAIELRVTKIQPPVAIQMAAATVHVRRSREQSLTRDH